MNAGAASHRPLLKRAGLAVLALALALCLSGCPSSERAAGPAAAAGDTTDEPSDAQQAQGAGQVEFSGAEDTEVTVRDGSGKVVYSGDVPCETKLPAGAYTWSVRYRDNQTSAERSLTVLAGDDQRVVVARPRTPLGNETPEVAPNLAPGAGQADGNKPWLNTEPIVPTGAPKSGLGGGKASDAGEKTAPRKSEDDDGESSPGSGSAE